MAEILVKAISVTHADPVIDQAGCYKRGHPVEVRPDGDWGTRAEERLPKFVCLKIPGVSVARVLSFGYHLPEQDVNGVNLTRRLWQIRWAALPQAAQDKLLATGELIIKVAPYNGAFDYTWAQVKGFFRNHATGLDETRDL